MNKSRDRLLFASFTVAVAVLFHPACTISKMSAEGSVQCYMSYDKLYRYFSYPDDTASREKLASWLDYSRSRYYSHLFFVGIPRITLILSNGTRVHFHRDFVHFETRTFIQRKRSRTAEDDAFCDYLKSIAPREKD